MQDSVEVVESPGTTKIFADNLNLLATSSEAEIFNNVNLVNDEGSSLKADSIKYNLLEIGKIFGILQENPDTWLGYGQPKNIDQDINYFLEAIKI